ncbi:SNF2-related protein [Segatella buccae]
MANNFGKTWWGEAWLCSLAHIDYANRIPRGARYARNGSVLSISIAEGYIKAKVQGSRRIPYNVTIKVEQFSQKEIDLLIDGILNCPIIVSELLNGKLSPAVLDIAEKQKLRVFPSTWRDLGMDCSCPDWAVPCKHIAAVIYKMGQEIDNNPFLVFELHGVNILYELKKRGVNIHAEEAVKIPEWIHIVQPVQQNKRDTRETPQVLRSFDFRKIVHFGDALQMLLPTAPAFYPDGDFNKYYAGNIKRLGKRADYILSGKQSMAEALDLKSGEHVIQRNPDIKIEIDNNLAVHTFFANKREVLSLTDLMQHLAAISIGDLTDYSNAIYAFRMTLQLSLILASSGNVIPMIGQDKKGAVMVVWTPATSDKQTVNILGELDKYFDSESISAGKTSRTKAAPEHPAWLLTTCFLTEMMKLSSKNITWPDKVYGIFFLATPHTFDGVGETNIPGAIKSWTDHLKTPQLRYLPVIMVKDESEEGCEFQLEMSVIDSETENNEMISVRDVFVDAAYNKTRLDILRDISQLSTLVNGLETYLAQEAEKPIILDNATFTRFLIQAVPAMRLLGIRLMLPKSLQQLLRPHPSMKLSAKSNDGSSFLRLDQLLQFSWQVAIGDELITPEEFNALVGRAEGLIKFKQQYIYVTADDLKRIEKTFNARNEMTTARMLQAALSEEYNSAKITVSPEVKALIKEWTMMKELDIPKEIKATLRPYQKRGYEWMFQNMQLGFGSILADDMGLGKTLQVITLMQKIKDDGMLDKKHIIVVAPTGLLANWQAELNRFAPRLNVFLYHGQNRSLEEFNHDILLTSYGLVRSDIDHLKKLKWAIVIIDEAQNIKNNTAAQSKAVKAIKADVHIAMSGTPVENRLSEYWSIMDFANKGYLGTIKTFNDEYAIPIQQKGDSDCAARFRRITAPMMMRRLKTDKTIINDLPDKIEQDEYAMLTPQQAALYHQVLEESMKTIEGFDEEDQKTLFKRQGLVLQMMLALKQICNHPAQYLKNGDFQPALSGKTEMLLALVNAINESGEKAIIFTQFKEMGDMLQQFITEATGRKPMFLHGGTDIKQRKEMIDRFQNNRSDRIFLLSLKAAGTGLNLTAATHVIHYDLWWNPAVEAQATDRAYRIGQKKNVMVHRFITRDTFEERINDMINNKRALADMTISTGESWIGKLSNKELRELFE